MVAYVWYLKRHNCLVSCREVGDRDNFMNLEDEEEEIRKAKLLN